MQQGCGMDSPVLACGRCSGMVSGGTAARFVPTGKQGANVKMLVLSTPTLATMKFVLIPAGEYLRGSPGFRGHKIGFRPLRES